MIWYYGFMTELSPHFMVCHMLEVAPECYQFSDWPLHLTVVPWFRVKEEALPNTLLAIEGISKRVGSFAIRAKANAWYGPQGNVPVTKVEDTTGRLAKLHHELLQSIQSNGGTILDLTYTGENYSPHVSLREDGSGLLPDQFVRCSSIAVVEKTRREVENKQVVKVISLV
jgi:2'-5' RNA ligase